MAREKEEFDWRQLEPKDWPENERLALAEIAEDESYIKTSDGKGMSAYYDSLGWLTKGVGHRVVGAKRREDLAGNPVSEMDMTIEEGNALLAKDYIKHRRDATRAPGWEDASPIQRRALTNLTFNLGANWWDSWPKFTEAATAGDYGLASDELVNSKWYGQVGIEPGQRGHEVVGMFRPPVEEEEFRIASLPGMWMGGQVGRSRYR